MSSKTHLNQAIASHLVEMKADSMPDRQVYIFEKGEHGEDILTYQQAPRQLQQDRPDAS